MTIKSALTTDPLIAVLRGSDPRKVGDAAKVLVDSGIQNLEITFTVPEATKVLSDLIVARPEARVGMGTLETPHDVVRAVDAGAQFLVSPGSSSVLLEAFLESGVESIPGVLTPSEAMIAANYGFHMLKLFPAEAVGKKFIKHVKGPLPGIDWVPSGGIAITAAGEWLAAGACGVGLGALATPKDIEDQKWVNIEEAAHMALLALTGEAP